MSQYFQNLARQSDRISRAATCFVLAPSVLWAVRLPAGWKASRLAPAHHRSAAVLHSSMDARWPQPIGYFRLEAGHANGGPIQEIATAVPGIRFSEYLPKLAQQAENLVLVRGMSTKEGDHGRALFIMRTGYLPEGPVEYPTLGLWSQTSSVATAPTCQTL